MKMILTTVSRFGTHALMYAVIRVLCFLFVGMWLSMNVWAWWLTGSYAECGVGIRLLGFFSWGILLSVLPLVLSCPQVSASGAWQWRDRISLPCMAALLVQSVLLLIWGADCPGARYCRSDVEILAASGIPIAAAVNIGGLVLIGVLHLIGRYVCCRVK